MQRALESINEKILAAVQRRGSNLIVANSIPRLIAVSKLKPNSAIIEAYECGQKFFGENYIQELETKSNSSEILERCPDIKFHFIGHLQKNKVPKLLNVRNLHMIETIDSVKLADQINRAIEKQVQQQIPLHFCGSNLNVMIQVNTSGEEQKNGIEPEEAPQLAEHIIKDCTHLHLAGIMTIGSIGGSSHDFRKLYETRESICKYLSMNAENLELSMGMSGDFEEAIEMGSTNVRVGTLIFGERPPKNTV